jgi:hypothetical protein
LTPCPICRRGEKCSNREKCQGKLLWDLVPATFKVTGISGKGPGNEPLIWLWRSYIRPGKLVLDFEHVFKEPSTGNVEEGKTP